MATDPLLQLWLASQRPRHHVLVRCRPGGFAAIAAEVTSLAAPPVRLRLLPGPLHLPPDKTGTLILNDVAALALADQIALCDWLAVGTGKLRVISITAVPLAALVERGLFLEGLFHRLGAVQFDQTKGEFLS
jgi:hypothetical protein